MFVRFRKTPKHLQVSVVETHRAAGKVAHDHIGALGSIRVPSSVNDRISFWAKLPSRLAALGNRIDGAAHGTILHAVYAKIPRPTVDELQAIQLENAKADAKLFEALRDGHAANLEADKELAARLAQRIAEREVTAAQAEGKAQDAAKRLVKAEQGEAIGGIGKPLTSKDLMAAVGWKPADFRHAMRLIEIEEVGANDDLMVEIMKRKGQVEKAASRAVLTRRRRSSSSATSV